MFNCFKDETGSALVMVLIITLILSVMGIAVGQYIYTSQLQNERNLNAVQAHYYAKAGVETAIGLVMLNFDSLENVLDQNYYGKIDGDFNTSVNEKADHNIEFIVSFDGTDIIIDSLGIVRSGDQTSLSSENLSYEIAFEDLKEIVGNDSAAGSQFPMALFTDSKLYLDGSASIAGSVATNSPSENSIDFAWSTYISNGDLFIGLNKDPLKVINSSQSHSPSEPYIHPNVTSGVISNLTSSLEFPQPKFPTFNFRSLPYMGTLTTTYHGPVTIDQDGYYDAINVVSNWKVIIDLNNETRHIGVGTLNVEQGQIELRNVGENGKLILYVEDNFILSGSSKVNENGDHRNVMMYYQGEQPINPGGSTQFVGSVFAKSADIAISGSGGVTGDIITNSQGGNVSISGAANAHTRVLYAPLANLDISGAGRFKGTAVVSQTKLQGDGTQIEADESLDLAFFYSLDWPEGRAPSLSLDCFGDSSRQGIWQRYGKWRLIDNG